MRRAMAVLLFAIVTPGGSLFGAIVDFDRDVAPLLVRRCLECHTGAEAKGGLDLSRRESAGAGGESGPVLAPGKLDESLLWEYVESNEMPPKKPLTAEEKETLKAWIVSGARWGTSPIDALRVTTDVRAGRDWWSLQPVSRPMPPALSSGGWGWNAIDGFISQRLEREGLALSTPSDRRVLIRRLAFDLLGLPPSPEEVEAFVADGREDAYERLVDRYLASPQYGVRWARLWLDLARFGESNGFEFDEFRDQAWPYRDWVVNALNRDLPYDQFARLQIAGDVLDSDDAGAIEATGFLVAGAYDSVGQNQFSQAMRKVVREDELEDLVGTVGQTFLGLTVHCARCHDHKFDPIKQTEYYQLSAALSGVRQGIRDLTELDPKVRAEKRAIKEVEAKLSAIEAPVLALLAKQEGRTAARRPPEPLARWEFEKGLEDRVGSLNARLQGGASLGRDGLRVGVKGGYAGSAPLDRDLGARTLEAWVQLDGIDQRGGGVISLQTVDGGMFDGIIFAEKESRQWMSGSEGFVRWRSFEGTEETEADKRVVHVAIVYDLDGTITAYRDGKPYGKAYRSSGLQTYRAGQAQVLFGLRHATADGNRVLSGRIVRARLYDRALTSEEVSASEEAGGRFTPEAVAALLDPSAKGEHARLLKEIETRRGSISKQTRRVHAVSPREPDSSHVLIRGNPTQLGAVVAAGGVASLEGLEADFGLSSEAPEAKRRERLASWLTDPRNPLFARVMVNRIWQAHFGTGLVENSSDLGFNGGIPSHPELLDWLASELMATGWSLKGLHRLILTSGAYRQSSTGNAKAIKVDAADRWLWRKAPRRLEAEMVRDAMLAVSGALNPRMGGAGFRDFSLSKAPGTTAILYAPIDAAGPDTDRRTLYRTWVRGGRSGFLDAFDCPDPSTTAPRRPVTTTPLQALALLNNALSLRLAERFGERLRGDAGNDPGSMVERAYRLAFGRPPDVLERVNAEKVVVEFGPAVLARAIFNSNEFLYVD